MIGLTLVSLFVATMFGPANGEPDPPPATTPTVSDIPALFVPANPADARSLHELELLFGPGRRVRDFARFTTERNEAAMLVLFVTAADPPQTMELDPMVSCPSEVAGIPLSGTYHLALVIGGKLINEIVIPGRNDWPDPRLNVLNLPLRNTRFFNYIFWGQGNLVNYGDPGAQTPEPTKLIKLADFTGDGHAWQFRVIRDGDVCGHKDTLLAGYSTQQRRAILYPLIEGKSLMYWHDNFFPHPDKPAAVPKVHYEFTCGDHGNHVLDEQDFEYNAQLEGWVMTRHDSNLCFGEYRGVRPTPTPTDIQIHVGSARGLPGDTVTVPVTLDPNGAEITGLQIDLPLSREFSVVGCTAGGDGSASFRVSSWGVRAIITHLSEERRHDWQHFDPLPNGSRLYTCQVHISSDTVPRTYAIALSGLLASKWGWEREHVTAGDGEILVLAPQTPTPDSQQ